MNYTMERWYSATGQRFSMRRYAGAPDAEDAQALAQTAAALQTRGARLVLCEDAAAFRSLFLGAGKVRGTPCFALLAQREADPGLCGYMGESFVLECAALGLGSCWLGASYRKNVAVQAAGLAPGERAVCAIAYGKPGEAYIGRPRKSLATLTGLTQAALVELPEWQQMALSCARLAPSAINAQPWEFLVEKERLGMRRTGENFGFGRLDQGIAMLHMELGAAHAGVSGSWKQEGDTAFFLPGS